MTDRALTAEEALAEMAAWLDAEADRLPNQPRYRAQRVGIRVARAKMRTLLATLDAARPTHPHDGYAYDGCRCACCVNVRALDAARPTLDVARARIEALPQLPGLPLGFVHKADVLATLREQGADSALQEPDDD